MASKTMSYQLRGFGDKNNNNNKKKQQKSKAFCAAVVKKGIYFKETGGYTQFKGSRK